MKIRLKNTKLALQDKVPLAFYHSTPGRDVIKTFKPLTHFGTKVAAQMRTMHFVYQALNIPEPAVLPQELPKSMLDSFHQLPGSATFTTYTVHLHMRSPIRMTDLCHHDLSGYYRWFSSKYQPKAHFLTFPERMEGDVIGPAKIRYKGSLSDFIFMDPFRHTESDLKKELSADTLYQLPLPPHAKDFPAYLKPISDKIQKLPFELPEHVAFQRMIRFLEGEGHDGFVYKNEYEDRGRDSYIIFRSEQVFDAKSPNVEHEIPALTPENKDFLKKTEERFFTSRGILSPTERIIKHHQELQKSRNRE